MGDVFKFKGDVFILNISGVFKFLSLLYIIFLSSKLSSSLMSVLIISLNI